MTSDALGGPDQRRRPANDPACDERQQQLLDDALADSFPASDPVSFITSQAEDCWDSSTPCDPANCADTGERDLSGVKKPAT
ncbi:MAG: hypothetical protein IRZ28_02405 [Steroidobacteraceae bacterium]|nr:hypothetical protein [Steroidobacteraceae bacterium]